MKKKRINIYKKEYIFILGALLLIAAFFINYKEALENPVTMESLFQEMIGADIELNKDLELEGDADIWHDSDSSSIYLTVTNISEDVIILNEILAELQVYRFNERFSEWEEVFHNVIVVPYDEIRLSPNSSIGETQLPIETSIDAQEQDSWLRFYVTGKNETTGEEVGAFVDIEIIRE